MEIFFGTIFILIISFLWALLSLKRNLKKQRREEDEETRSKNVDNEEVVLFERHPKRD